MSTKTWTTEKGGHYDVRHDGWGYYVSKPDWGPFFNTTIAQTKTEREALESIKADCGARSVIRR